MSRPQGQIKTLGPNKHKCIIFLGSVAGKNKYKSRTVTGTKKQAKQALNSMLADKDAFSPHVLASKPLEVYAKHYLKKLEQTKQVRGNSLKQVTYSFKKYVIPELGHIKLERLKSNQVQKWLDDLALDLAPSTVRLHFAYLRAMLNTAEAEGVLVKNPCPKKPKLAPKKKKEVKAFTATQLASVLENATGQARAFLSLLASTGMRPCEARALTWLDLDPQKAEITISKSADELGHVVSPTKTNRIRRVTLPLSALKELTALPQESDLIFHNGFGERLSHTGVSKWFNDAAQKAGIKGFSLYCLRHTHVSLLISAGENITVISQRVGHTNTSTTLNVYSHLLPGLEAKAAEKWERLYGLPERPLN